MKESQVNIIDKEKKELSRGEEIILNKKW